MERNVNASEFNLRQNSAFACTHSLPPSPPPSYNLTWARDPIENPVAAQSQKTSELDELCDTGQWTPCFDSCQRQVLRIQSTMSEPLSISCSIPQGSLLGPLLFSTYTNDLPSAPQKCSVQSYVDVAKLQSRTKVLKHLSKTNAFYWACPWL